MTKQFLKCEACGGKLRLDGQTVFCTKCRSAGVQVSTGTLMQAMLSLESQAAERGQTIDPTSIKPDVRGRLTFSAVDIKDVSPHAIPNDPYADLPDDVGAADTKENVTPKRRFA